MTLRAPRPAPCTPGSGLRAPGSGHSDLQGSFLHVSASVRIGHCDGWRTGAQRPATSDQRPATRVERGLCPRPQTPDPRGVRCCECRLGEMLRTTATGHCTVARARARRRRRRRRRTDRSSQHPASGPGHAQIPAPPAAPAARGSRSPAVLPSCSLTTLQLGKDVRRRTPDVGRRAQRSKPGHLGTVLSSSVLGGAEAGAADDAVRSARQRASAGPGGEWRAASGERCRAVVGRWSPPRGLLSRVPARPAAVKPQDRGRAVSHVRAWAAGCRLQEAIRDEKVRDEAAAAASHDWPQRH